MKKLIKLILRSLYSICQKTLSRRGYRLQISKVEPPIHIRCGTNLNVAAGRYVIDGFISLDFFSDHYYSSKSEFDATRIHYDIRRDFIPYADETVDNIYISHAIEHIETEFVERFFVEAARVLKPMGVLRIACPDAKFLYEVSKFKNDYWAWREPTLKTVTDYEGVLGEVSTSDYLTRELATPKMRQYRNRVSDSVSAFDVPSRPYADLMSSYRDGLIFRVEHPGDHINNWDFDRLASLGREVGFRHIIESKCQGSISKEMQGEDFDRTAPQMSLYVDFMK